MSEEPDFEARDQWGNALWYKCHTCGHVWKAGQSGSHNCVDLLKPALDAALARAEKAESMLLLAKVDRDSEMARADALAQERDEWQGECARLRDKYRELLDEHEKLSRDVTRHEFDAQVDQARIATLESECTRLREELAAAHSIEAELITLKAQDRLDPLRLEMAEAEANGLRLLHESDKVRIATLESECARLRKEIDDAHESDKARISELESECARLESEVECLIQSCSE